MALLEPCLPIWLMDKIKPPKWQLGTVFLPDSIGYWVGTNFFAVVALKQGRHKTAMAALMLLGRFLYFFFNASENAVRAILNFLAFDSDHAMPCHKPKCALSMPMECWGPTGEKGVFYNHFHTQRFNLQV